MSDPFPRPAPSNRKKAAETLHSVASSSVFASTSRDLETRFSHPPGSFRLSLRESLAQPAPLAAAAKDTYAMNEIWRHTTAAHCRVGRGGARRWGGMETVVISPVKGWD